MSETGMIKNGFRVVCLERIPEIDSNVRILQHDKSGAHLMHIENDDDNKVFAAAFLTPPDDDTGLTHILEHCVLSGSRKFPVKEPMMEAVKGSLKTFINAFTMPLITMYPVASVNDKDFHNLMDIYLDAVFFPRIYDYDEIMMQEGWHYELENMEDELVYKGVVYNEMKGALSSPDNFMMRRIMATLLPDTPFRYNSGGDPDYIPDLTHDQFKAYHRKFYHPSNSYLFLSGNGDIEKQLKFIDEDFLSHFDKMDIKKNIVTQPAFDQPKEFLEEYPIAASSDKGNKTFLSMNWVTGLSTDTELTMAFGMLSHMLFNTPAAPLRRALIEAGVGKEVSGRFFNSATQSIFGVVVNNSDQGEEEKFKKIVLETLEHLVENGIDKKMIEASINIHEFHLREAESGFQPKGLTNIMSSVNGWIYKNDPFSQLKFEDDLKKVKTALTGDYFEKLIKQYLLDNNHRSTYVLKPRAGLVEEMNEKERNRLKKHRDKLSTAELENILNQTKVLQLRQQTPDTPEQLSVIPLLTLGDVKPEAAEIPLEKRQIEGLDVLYHPLFTNGIGYLDLYFDSSSVPQDQLPYIGLLSRVLSKIGTKNYGFKELSKEKNIHTGMIHTSVSSIVSYTNESEFYPKVNVQSKALIEKLPKLCSLLKEIVCLSDFSDKNRLREILNEIKVGEERKVSFYSSYYAQQRASSYVCADEKYDEIIHGISFTKFIYDLVNNFDSKIDEIVNNLISVSKKIFNRSNLVMSFTSGEEDYQKFSDEASGLISSLNTDSVENTPYEFDLTPKNEGLYFAGKVQSVYKVFNFKRLGYEYSGKMSNLGRITQLDFLWGKIREQGGAYIVDAGFSKNGMMSFGSGRDPNLKETLDTFDKVADFLRSFSPNEREMRKYILGSVSGLDHPVSNQIKAQISNGRFFSGMTQDHIQKIRDEVLSTSAADIRGFGDMVDEAMKKNCFAVVGGEEKIKAHRDLFGSIESIME